MNLNVDEMDLRCPGISDGINTSFKEAIKVCLEINKHRQGQIFTIEGHISNKLNILWRPATQQLFDSWSDHQETTEVAACGIAVHIILSNTNYTVRNRSWKGTGFDYWLGAKNAPESLFQNVAKLEVSGIAEEKKANKITSRVKRKINQIDKFKDKYPALLAFIVIVEFSAPKSLVHLIK